MSKYKSLKKGNVYITNGYKRLFYGMRTLYTKDLSGKVYVRYKNRYYRAYRDGHYSYTVIV